jgi:hypothetical protein
MRHLPRYSAFRVVLLQHLLESAVFPLIRMSVVNLPVHGFDVSQRQLQISV